jgi:hypothetical protein
MIFLATAALATTSPSDSQPSRSAVTVSATATIRVVSGISLKLGAATNPGAPPTRDSIIHTADGIAVAAKLIEFQ